MKFKQAKEILESYIALKDYIYEVVEINDEYSIEYIYLNDGSLNVKFSYIDRDRDYYVEYVTLPPIAFDNKEAWLKQLEEEKEEKKRQAEKEKLTKLEAYKEQRRQEYEKLKKEFEK